MRHAEWVAAASTPHARLVAAYVALGDGRRAVDLLTKATTANPQLPAADWLVLALAHARLKETDQARKACGKAAELLKAAAAEDALRPLVREVLIAVGPDAGEAKALLEAAAGEPPPALTAAIEQNPDKAAGYLDRGTWFADRGRWKDAIADLTEAYRLEPDPWTGMKIGIFLVQTGQIDRYRSHCQAMLDRWGSTEKNGEADVTLKTIILLPNYKADAEALARLAEVAVSGDKKADWFEWYLFAKGLHDYRTGKYADALATCREIRLRAPKALGDRRVLTSLNLALEAMACHRSGDEVGAKRALAEAKAYIEVNVPGIDAAGWTNDWLAAHILYREAEGLIAGKKVKGK
jgi:tetratricopeptide (TPR) repeat protein